MLVTLTFPVLAGDYKIHEDKGQAAAWEWFKKEVIVKCIGGRNDGDYKSVYLKENGKWEGNGYSFSDFDSAASKACDAL